MSGTFEKHHPHSLEGQAHYQIVQDCERIYKESMTRSEMPDHSLQEIQYNSPNDHLFGTEDLVMNHLEMKNPLALDKSDQHRCRL